MSSSRLTNVDKQAPKFFRLTDAATGDPCIPIADRPDVQLAERRCPGCGARLTPRVGVASCDIERGAAWTDAIGNPNWSLILFSERVLSGLTDIGASGISPLEVRIREVRSETLRALSAPSYYYFNVAGRIDVDLEASGLGGVERCPVCFRVLAGRHPQARRFVPRHETWDGADVFSIRNSPNSMLFCTRRVLELARRDRWTNFRFEPMDVVRDHATQWGGIDYLGPTWPPEIWYPPSPSEGTTLAEWLARMRSEDKDTARRARMAVADIAQDEPGVVVPQLIAMLDDPDEKLRVHAARLLFRVDFRYPLSPEIKRRVHPLLPPDIAPAWGPVHATHERGDG